MIFKALFGRKDSTAEVGGTKELLTLSKRVDAPLDRAFSVFIEELDRWWPREHTWAKESLDRIAIEPRMRGSCFELSKDGAKADWGTVLTVDRPNHIVFTWQIRPDRTPEPNEAMASRVDIRFVENEPGTTDVLVVHRDFYRHGEGWEKYRQDMASKTGWPHLMDLYAKAVA
jgi:uncharacterized protein YndB with AHSA1/START domain